MVWEILLDRLAGLRGGEHVTRDVRLIGIPMAVLFGPVRDTESLLNNIRSFIF